VSLLNSELWIGAGSRRRYARHCLKKNYYINLGAHGANAHPYSLTHEHGQPVYDPQGWPDRRPCLNPDHTLFLLLASDGKRIAMILVYSVRPCGRPPGHDTGAGQCVATFDR
jgi:hypothetical protein